MTSKIKKLLNNFDKESTINAKNSDNSSDLFSKRVLYKEMAYTSKPVSTTGANLLPIRDFSKYENCLYGRVNMEFETVVPKKIFIKPIGTEGEHALYFVSDAFLDLQQDIATDVASGKIPDNIPIISNLMAMASYEDINVKYNDWYVTAIQGGFLDYIREFEDIKEIVDFKSFLKIFKNHIYMMADQADSISFSSFCMGRRSNIRNSGLVVEVSDMDFSRDAPKIEFASGPYFSYYVKKAEKYGFFVDYNAPWRLVANLASPVMVRRGGYDGMFSFFSKYYEKSSKFDLTILKNMAFSIYSSLVELYPTFEKKEILANGCQKEKLIIRQRLSKAQLDKDYPDSFWVQFYIDLKNVEKNLDFNTEELLKIKKNALDYEKYLDISKSLGYINRVFQDIPSLEGSFYSLLNKQIYRSQDSQPFENFDEYIKKVVRSYRSKVE
jgi:hypothetical protein